MENVTSYESLGKKILEKHCETYYARKKGKSHVENGTVCQDYCLVENIGSDIQIVCIADGHGGEAYTKSDKGSYYACSVFVEFLKTIKANYEKKKDIGLWIDVLRTADFKKAYLQMWKQTVVEDYKKENNNTTENVQSIVKKYGTTFLFVVVCPEYYVVGQLGDGAILLSNKEGQHQLFKRHSVKTSSATSSLASNRAEFAFVIDIYEKKYFSNVLMSTDGIYDKLDTDNAFFLYEEDLLQQIKENGELKSPFVVSDIDVSNISKDDCTIALIVQNQKEEKIMLDDYSELGFENIRFLRYSKGVSILEGEKQGKKFEIHAVSTIQGELDCEIQSVKLLKSEQIVKINGKAVAFIYEIPERCHRVAALVDSGEHLEKRYWFNDNEVSVDDDSVTGGLFSNEYWLSFYEQLISLEEELKTIKVSINDCANESMFITDKNEIVILSDVLSREKDRVNTTSINRLLSRFSIIGKLSCGKISIPLFETITQGQSIAMLHVLSERKVLCKVIYNSDKKIFGLWNVTGFAWNLESGKRKNIPEQGVMRLNKDQVFYVAPDGFEKNPDAEFVDGYAKYQVKMLRG